MEYQHNCKRHLRALFLLLGLACLLPAMAEQVIVADANGNKLTYTYTEASGPATFTAVNAYADDAGKAGRIIIADRVTDANGQSHDVKYIGGSVGNRSKLVSITFGKNIVSTGGADGMSNSAFLDCDLLESVTLNARFETLGQYTFAYCDKLATINLGAATSLKKLLYRAFYSCSALQTITIPATVQEVGDGLLDYCGNLQTLTFNAANIPNNLCYGMGQLATVNIGAGVKSIGRSAFQNCDALTTISIASSVSGLDMGYHAFYDCDKLRTVSLPKGVRSLGEGAFNGCDSLRTVTIATGSQLDSIGRYAFAYCDKLQSINLEAATSLKHIMYRVFYYCSALQAITVPASVQEFGLESNSNDMLGYCLAVKTITWLAASVPNNLYRSYNDGKLTTINIGAGVKRIGNYAFANNYHLKQLNIDAGVSGLSIGEYAFAECDSLSSVSLPKGVAVLEKAAFRSNDNMTSFTFAEGSTLSAIPQECFYYCYSLQRLSLPNSVQTVANGAFGYCRALAEISFGTGLTSLPDDWYLFTNCEQLRKVTLPGVNYPFPRKIWMPDDVVLYVNAGLAEEYRSNAFTSDYRIVAIGEQSVFAVTTTAGGQLQDKLSEDQTQNLQELTISGPINGTDINYLHSSMPNLRVLNLKNARIVAGGDKYNQWSVSANGIATIESYYGSWATEDNVVGYAMFYNMPALESITLPDGTTKIGQYALAQNRRINWRLAKVDIPSTVTEIGDYAFYYAGITTATVPSGVTELKPYTFWHCEKLQKATLPNGIYTIGSSAFSECYELAEVNLPTQVQTIDEYAFYNNYKRQTPLAIPNTCTAIGNYAFRSNHLLPSVTFGNSLQTVGSFAFADCDLIEQAQLPQTVTKLGDHAFYNCDSLRSFAFPQGIKQVPGWVLQGCDGLQSVTLASGTTSIGENAFDGCKRLATINLAGQNELATIGNYAFYNTALQSVTLPNTITSMGYAIFQYCHQLQRINVPTGIDYVPYDFCEGCENLQAVQLHPGLRTVRHDAFYGCNRLESIELSNQITSIEYNAFRDCASLPFMALPSGLTFLGSWAFGGAKAFKGKVVVPTGVTTIEGGAFRESGITGVVLPEGIGTWGTDIFYHCDSLSTVRLPQDMRRITNYMFQDCPSLTAITLPDSLTEIGYAAFQRSGLTSVILPDSIQKVESYAFSGTKLTTFRVPDGFTSDLGSYTLENCKELRSVYFGRNQDYSQWSSFTCVYGCDSLKLMRVYAGTPPKSDTSWKEFRTKCVLEVPEEMVELYRQATFWKDFKEIRGFFVGDVLNELDYAVLQLLYNKLGGKNWTNKWNLDNDHHAVGKWSGVTTEKMGKATSTTYAITSINLAGQGLTGQLPDSLFMLKRLQSLNLSNNALTGNLGQLLDQRDVVASSLTEVNLQGNQLKGDIAPFLQRVPNVTKVDVSYNRLTAFSEVFPNNKLTNNNLSRGYQFIDYKTKEVVSDPDMPVIDVTPGIPFAIEPSTLQSYRHERGDFGYASTALYRVYSNGNGGFSTSDWELQKQSNGLWNLYAGTTNYVLTAPKGQPAAYNDGNPWWSPITYILRFDWQDGDVNADQTVDVTDLQSVVYYAMNDRKPAEQLYNYTAADANSDKRIDVADVVGSVDCILSYEQPSQVNARAYKNEVADDSRNVLSMTGDAVLLNHADEIAALQFTVSGVRQGQLKMGEELKGRFTVAMRSVENGVRVVVYSPSGRTLQAGTHQLLVGLPAGASLADVCLSDAEAHRLGVSINGTTAVSFASVPQQQAARQIYDLSGRRLNADWDELPTGVYVVRANGRQYKVKK